MADESEKARDLADLIDKVGSCLQVTALDTLFNDTGGILLDTELRNLSSQLFKDRPVYLWLPLLDNRAHGIVTIGI